MREVGEKLRMTKEGLVQDDEEQLTAKNRKLEI